MRSCSSGEIFFLHLDSLQCQRERPSQSEADQHRDDTGKEEQEEEPIQAGAGSTSEGEVTLEVCQEDGLGQWLETGHGDDGEEEDVLHCCLCCLLKLMSPGFSRIL